VVTTKLAIVMPSHWNSAWMINHPTVH